MKKILVTGANGQLGSELRKLFTSHKDYIFTDIDELNLLDPLKLNNIFNENEIRFVINCAAYTAVDKAESEPEIALKVNATAVKNLIDSCKIQNPKIVHISTDFVFDGLKSSNYSETDMENPINIYGKSKHKGELYLRNEYSKYFILRTSWLYSKFGNNFVKTIRRIAKERDEIKVVCDQVGTPTHAKDLANTIKLIIESDSNDFGIYNYSNEGTASWYDFAKNIVEISEIKCKIYPIETKEYATAAKRPSLSVLSKSKIKAVFGIEIPYWRDSLKKCLNEE